MKPERGDRITLKDLLRSGVRTRAAPTHPSSQPSLRNRSASPRFFLHESFAAAAALRGSQSAAPCSQRTDGVHCFSRIRRDSLYQVGATVLSILADVHAFYQVRIADVRCVFALRPLSVRSGRGLPSLSAASGGPPTV